MYMPNWRKEGFLSWYKIVLFISNITTCHSYIGWGTRELHVDYIPTLGVEYAIQLCSGCRGEIEREHHPFYGMKKWCSSQGSHNLHYCASILSYTILSLVSM